MTRLYNPRLLFAVLLAASFLWGGQAAAQSEPQFDCEGFFAAFKMNIAGREVSAIPGLPQICSAENALLATISVLLQFGALVAVIAIMVGGYWYLTAGGNEETSEKGRKTLTNAVLGLVVILMAFAIVRIVANFVGSAGQAPPEGGAPSGEPRRPSSDNPNSPPASSAPISQDPANLYHYITREDVDNFNNQNVPRQGIYDFKSGQGLRYSLVTSSSDKQFIVFLYKACGGSDPSITIKLNDGSYYDSGTFQRINSQQWNAAIDSDASLGKASSFFVSACGNAIIEEVTIPEQFRPRN